MTYARHAELAKRVFQQNEPLSMSEVAELLDAVDPELPVYHVNGIVVTTRLGVVRIAKVRDPNYPNPGTMQLWDWTCVEYQFCRHATPTEIEVFNAEWPRPLGYPCPGEVEK